MLREVQRHTFAYSEPLSVVVPNAQEFLLKNLRAARKECARLGLRVSAGQIASAIKRYTQQPPTYGAAQTDFANLERSIALELKGRWFLALSPEMAAQYDHGPERFGPEVSTRFPRTIVDIEEAGKCLALDRSTACVFHLMRVVEVGLQAYGAKMGLQLADVMNWQKILSDVNGVVKRLPCSTREEKEYLGKCQAVHAHLQSVKDAWRNDVMHPLASHTPEQALDIWNHTAALMRKLADFV